MSKVCWPPLRSTNLEGVFSVSINLNNVLQRNIIYKQELRANNVFADERVKEHRRVLHTRGTIYCQGTGLVFIENSYLSDVQKKN